MANPRGTGLRSVADQTEVERGGRRSILSRQSADHADLDALVHAYEDADRAGDADGRASAVAELAERALRHAFAEEVVLFPAYRRRLGGAAADELTAHIEGDHQQINDLLRELQRTDPADPGHPALVRRAVQAIRHDAHDEEDDLLPRLQQVTSPRRLRAIGDAWEAARLASPTRPHPRIARRPPGNALAALGLGVSDRVKDVVDDVAPPATARRAALAGLVAGAAGTVVMTLGERVEQAVTGRPDSHMPAHTLQALLRRPVRDSAPWNAVMHYGQGAAVGAVRALMARAGLRGAAAWPVFTLVRLATDQTLENGTGVGELPWRWSRTDQVVDVLHKAVYALATGLVADRLVPRRGQGLRRPGARGADAAARRAADDGARVSRR